MYTVLNLVFNFIKKAPNTNKIVINKNILKKINFVFYNLIFLVYKFFIFLLYPFQRAFINLYTAQLQLNRLPYRIIPNSIKFIFIYFVDIDSWILFFKRIKNHNNLYIVREKRYIYLHRLWCVFFRNKTIYYPELNIKRSKHNKISNFFYRTRIQNKFTKKPSGRKYKFIFFYYIDKLVFHKYPYFYWTYMFAYNKYQYNPEASNLSQHIRSQILFFFINAFVLFSQKHKNQSFVKFDFYSFKGIKKALSKSGILKLNKYIIKTKQLKDKIITKAEDQLSLLDKNFIKIYYDIYKIDQPQHKFYLHSIIRANRTKFQIAVNNIFLNAPKIFIIKWYNKIHNSISNPLKNNTILFLRATKHFNKGRYSRNRQLYRTGVYWCIWLNVIIVYSLHFYFYRVVYSFGYLWTPLIFMIFSIFISRIYKYRHYNIKQLIVEFKEFNNFLFYLLHKIRILYILISKNKISKYKNYLFNYIVLLYKYGHMKIFLIIIFFKKIFL